MSKLSKALQAAAGNAGVGTFIENVFSTYLYAGNSSTQTITNGIDLAGEGGLVWVKARSFAGSNVIADTERGADQLLVTNSTLANTDYTSKNGITAFNSDGFSLGSDTDGVVNLSGHTFASWTFRKAPRWFDVVTYTGTGSVRTIAHNLGVAPGCIIIKETSAARNWYVYHRSNGSTKYMYLNLTDAAATSSLAFNNTDPTDTEFTVGTINGINNSGATYVAYLFAHDPLGPSGDGSDGLIACGSYTGTGANGNSVSVGWEPQWVLVKRTDVSGYGWFLIDNMRGMPSSTGGSSFFRAELSNAESTLSTSAVAPTPTGLEINGTSAAINASGGTYIYIAIRRGPMRQPTSGTEVFATEIGDGVSTKPALFSGFPVDAAFLKLKTGGDSLFGSRLQGPYYMQANLTNAETDDTGWTYDYMNGWYGGTARNSNFVSWMFRRAPGFFDAVAYDGGVASHAVPHNLGVTPEMYFIKCRSDGAANRAWAVYHKDLTDPANYYLKLNDNIAQSNLTNIFNGTTDASTFGVRDGFSIVNESGQTYIAYLFASSPGVSKVGSYTGNGTSQTINCGFTSGARFILIKRIDSSGAWYVWDTERGIVAGNDPHLSLNNTAAEITTDDSVDPDNSGFIVNQDAATNINVSSATYIFYAIA